MFWIYSDHISLNKLLRLYDSWGENSCQFFSARDVAPSQAAPWNQPITSVAYSIVLPKSSFNPQGPKAEVTVVRAYKLKLVLVDDRK